MNRDGSAPHGSIAAPPRQRRLHTAPRVWHWPQRSSSLPRQLRLTPAAGKRRQQPGHEGRCASRTTRPSSIRAAPQLLASAHNGSCAGAGTPACAPAAAAQQPRACSHVEALEAQARLVRLDQRGAVGVLLPVARDAVVPQPLRQRRGAASQSSGMTASTADRWRQGGARRAPGSGVARLHRWARLGVGAGAADLLLGRRGRFGGLLLHGLAAAERPEAHRAAALLPRRRCRDSPPLSGAARGRESVDGLLSGAGFGGGAPGELRGSVGTKMDREDREAVR